MEYLIAGGAESLHLQQQATLWCQAWHREADVLAKTLQT